LINYLKDKTKTVKVFTKEFNAALIITVAFVIGTYWMVPPFSWIMSLNDHFKDSGAVKYGEPPYGHAELSPLKTFAEKMNLDLAQSMKLLNEAGYTVNDSASTLQAIGKQYDVPPQLIFDTIKPASIVLSPESAGKITLPDSPPPGTGNLTLADFCVQYNLSSKKVIRELKGRGISVSADLTLKEIASQNQTSPIDLFETIKNIVKT
jgi:hypothetical protein